MKNRKHIRDVIEGSADGSFPFQPRAKHPTLNILNRGEVNFNGLVHYISISNAKGTTIYQFRIQ